MSKPSREINRLTLSRSRNARAHHLPSIASAVDLASPPDMQPATSEQLSDAASIKALDDSLTPRLILKGLLICARSSSPEAIAQDLLDHFGSLSAVLAAEPHRLCKAHALDEPAIALLKLVQAAVQRVVREPIEERRIIASRSALLRYLSVTMRHDTVETLRVIFLDSKNGLIKDEVMARGTIDHVPVYPRELIRRSLDLNASAIILVHNHPSGNPVPSKLDIEMTIKLVEALNVVNVAVHDHVIVGRNKEISMKKMGLMGRK